MWNTHIMYRCNFSGGVTMYRWLDVEPDDYRDIDDDMYDDYDYEEDDYRYSVDMPYMYCEPAFYGMCPVALNAVNPYMEYNMCPMNYMMQPPPPAYPYCEGDSSFGSCGVEDLQGKSIDNKSDEEDKEVELDYLEEQMFPYNENCDVKMRTVDMSDILD